MKIPISKNMTVYVFDFIPTSEIGGYRHSIAFIGRRKEVGYAFLLKMGPFGHFKVPSDIQIGEEWHFGHRGDELTDRFRFKIDDFTAMELEVTDLGKVPTNKIVPVTA